MYNIVISMRRTSNENYRNKKDSWMFDLLAFTLSKCIIYLYYFEVTRRRRTRGKERQTKPVYYIVQV